MKLWLYLKLQGYFGYENDRTHVINVVVLVVKITIQLTYGILGFKKKKRDFKVIMLRIFYVIARKPLLDERTSPKCGDIIKKNMLKCIL
jgi:hypothetical protein